MRRPPISIWRAGNTVVYAPSITGTVANQATTSEAAIDPFSGVTIADANSGATDTLTITVGGTGGTLSGAGLNGGTGGIYTLNGTASAVTGELDALVFTPTGGAPNTASTSTFSLNDVSTAYSTPTVDTTTSVIDNDPAVAPTISGTVADQATTWEKPIDPFSKVTIAEANSGATDTLTIRVGGTGGTLTGSGLSGGTGGVYTLSGTVSQITTELDALSFTPTGGGPDTTSISTFTLSDLSSAYATPTVDTTTTVVDADASNDWSITHSVTSRAGDIYAIYEGLLGRAPDEFGYENWLAALQGGEPLDEIVKGFLSSAEYTGDFGNYKHLSNRAFIDNLYETALHRQPDPGGLHTYEAALANGTSRQDVALDVVLSDEARSDLQPSFSSGVLAPDARVSLFGSFVQDFSSEQGEVYALYEGLLSRSPEPTEFENWTAALQGGQSVSSVARDLLSSAEFTADFGSYTKLSNTQFIDDLYATALHRQPDAAGLQNYETALANGTSRQRVALDIALSSEAEGELTPSLYQGVVAPSSTDSQIARLYYGLLNRAPDAPGLASWEAAAASGTSMTTIARDFIESQEYKALHGSQSNDQFLTSLYQDALGRAPDAAGFHSWSSALSSGLSRASVALGISESPEAQQHLAANIEVGMKLA